MSGVSPVRDKCVHVHMLSLCFELLVQSCVFFPVYGPRAWSVVYMYIPIYVMSEEKEVINPLKYTLYMYVCCYVLYYIRICLCMISLRCLLLPSEPNPSQEPNSSGPFPGCTRPSWNSTRPGNQPSSFTFASLYKHQCSFFP